MKNDDKRSSLINSIKNAGEGIWISLCLSFMLMIFAPLELFLTNQGEFWFTTGDLLLCCVPMAAAAFFAAGACAALLDGKTASEAFDSLSAANGDARRIMMYTYTKEEHMTEYTVKGKAYDSDSAAPTGREFIFDAQTARNEK